jgi:hypothetical protein
MTKEVIARGRSPRGNLFYTNVRLLRAKALAMTSRRAHNDKQGHISPYNLLTYEVNTIQ